MERCATCKHWSPNHERENCRRPPDDRGYGDCSRIDEESEPPALAILLLTEMGHLKTLSGFGCALHEPREGIESP